MRPSGRASVVPAVTREGAVCPVTVTTPSRGLQRRLFWGSWTKPRDWGLGMPLKPAVSPPIPGPVLSPSAPTPLPSHSRLGHLLLCPLPRGPTFLLSLFLFLTGDSALHRRFQGLRGISATRDWQCDFMKCYGFGDRQVSSNLDSVSP